MLDYLYTTKYTAPTPSDPDLFCCRHDEAPHSFDNTACYLWPYGLSVAMYSLGDMYDIPGLRRYSCVRLQKLFNLNPYLDWTDAMSV